MKEGIKGGVDMEKFEKKLESLINECCLENGSDTPDFILAHFLRGCLTAFNSTLQSREKWYGRELCFESRDEGKVDNGPIESKDIEEVDEEELVKDLAQGMPETSEGPTLDPLGTINAVVFNTVMYGWGIQSPSSVIKTVVADLFSLENRWAVKEYLQEVEEKDK